jgi:murein DD-endopeptidase MepM/ murein hydrolase activator NlpD
MPFLAVWRFFVSIAIIPTYRTILVFRRHIAFFLQPAKHRVAYIVSNRYAFHAVVVALALLTSALNVTGEEVRAETFGQKSALYRLVAHQDWESIETVTAKGFAKTTPVSYLEDTVVDVNAHIDLNYVDEDYVTTRVGGDSLTSPVMQETGEKEATLVSRTENIAYTVEEGDVLGSIAEKYGLNLSTILWANNLTFRSVIRPGQELVIPPVDGVMYKVKSGDTLLGIAKRYSADMDTILSFNHLSATDTLSIGQSLILPGGEPPVSTPSRTAPVTSLFASAPSGARSPSSSGTWLWPTDWYVITQYFGWRHTGLDVDGDYSTNNYASRDGVVIYSGWRNGYGLTVELDHGDGYVTRYAHNNKNYVNIGDVVMAGEPLGQMGTTGRSTGTHLHFEIIKNGKFLNPLDYIR